MNAAGLPFSLAEEWDLSAQPDHTIGVHFQPMLCGSLVIELFLLHTMWQKLNILVHCFFLCDHPLRSI